SCQAPSFSFQPWQTRRNATKDSSEGAKSAPSTRAIKAVKLSFTVIKLIPLGVSRMGVASPSSSATFLYKAVAAAATGSSLGRFINSLSRARSCLDRKSTRLNSSHRTISYAVFCLKKKKKKNDK